MLTWLRRWRDRREARAGYRMGREHVAAFGLYTMSTVLRHRCYSVRDAFDLGYHAAIEAAEAEAFGTSIFRN